MDGANASRPADRLYDCVIVGAGPGGLSAAIYLGRYNRSVLMIDRSGGRTSHARHIENFLSQPAITGQELIERGLEQARRFNVEIRRDTVTGIRKAGPFEVTAGDIIYRSRFVIVSTGGRDNLPPIENIHQFFGESYFTCVDCDGYRTTGKKLVVLGNSIPTVHLALAVREMYTPDITLIVPTLEVPEVYRDELRESGIRLITGPPARLLGEDHLEAVEMRDGRRVECEVILSHFGYTLNDSFLEGLKLKRDAGNNKYVTNRQYESSCDGLYIVGPLAGPDQAIVAAGEGALAAMDLKKRLIEL